MELLIAALGLGLLTGFHCIGMCGPIALVLPLNNKSWGTRILSAMIYNIGRTVTYASMGAVLVLLERAFLSLDFKSGSPF